jgi:hypothetical protein
MATCIKYPEHPNTWYHFQLENSCKRIVCLRSSAILNYFTDIYNENYTKGDFVKLHFLIEELESHVAYSKDSVSQSQNTFRR